MKIAYFDCFSGISGDMTLGALIDAGADPERIQSAIVSMGLPQIRLHVERTRKHGFRAIRARIETPPEHVHRHWEDIKAMIARGNFSPAAKRSATRMFKFIAQAEGKVHGVSPKRIHFHEVGAADSIADIVGVSVAMDQLQIRKTFSSFVPVGTGCIQIAHGKVSVPAPATALLLRDVPIQNTDIQAELTTPTGAAILRHFASQFGPLPSMKVQSIGCGAGTIDLREQPNILRVFIGRAATSMSNKDSVVVLETNIDDLPGEQIGYAIEKLIQAGALDVFTIPIQMKKQRPGVMLTVLASPSRQTQLEQILFEETNTLGIRSSHWLRSKLPRKIISISTPWGMVKGKLAQLPSRRMIFSPEYDDCSRIASENSISLSSVIEEVTRLYHDRVDDSKPFGS